MTGLHVSMHWAEANGGTDPRMRELWVRMRCCLPQVLGAVLLPSGAELLVAGVRIDELLARLQGLAERARLQRVGFVHRLGPSTPSELAQRIETLHRAPTRLAGIDDPLQWPWSTSRDRLGAVIDPWVMPTSAAQGHALRDVALPRRAERSDVPCWPLREVLRAAAAATRRPVAAVGRPGPTRRVFVGLSHRHGWWMPRHLAAICGISRRALYKQLQRIPAAWLEAGALCLGDPRLRQIVLDSPASRLDLRAITAVGVCSTP